jgi:predicted Zn-dependent protease
MVGRRSDWTTSPPRETFWFLTSEETPTAPFANLVMQQKVTHSEINLQTVRSLFWSLLAPILIATILAGCSRESKKSRLVEEAGRYFSAAEYDKARIEYLNLLRVDPQNATAIQQLGIIWSEQGAPLRALPFLVKARELSPANLNVRTKLAVAFLSLGNVAEARKEALAILDQTPTNDEALLLLADTARTQQEISEVEERLKKFDGRTSKTFHLGSASLYLRKGDLSSAENAVQRALDLDPKLPAAHLALGNLHWLRGDRAQAAQEFKTAADLAPIRSLERLKYAEFEAKTGRIDAAANILKEITRQAPDYLPAWGRLAQMAFAQKKYDESLALLENVFSRDAANLKPVCSRQRCGLPKAK